MLEVIRPAPSAKAPKQHPWFWVLWLTGVDYFSSLAYQPGLALIAAGVISPLATLILVGVTLFGALPTYYQVARYSYAGQGSIAMIEHLLTGWRGKIVVLVLLGFASTDFVITMTLSAADAVQHLIENPFMHGYLDGMHVPLTILLLALLAMVFLKGFSEAIAMASIVAIPYLVMNAIVLGAGFKKILEHPNYLTFWRESLAMEGDWTSIIIISGFVFPKLALGMSGYETAVSTMPMVAGDAEGAGAPKKRIRATRKLLFVAALTMCVMLMASSWVSTLLISHHDYKAGAAASGRAIAFLAHELLGDTFGSLYDISTIAILWFAGASAMTGLLAIIPRYLPRFGMAPEWVSQKQPFIALIFVICVGVTVIFDANVEAQGGAYATGVLVLILSASVAVAMVLRRESLLPGPGARRAWFLSKYFWMVSAVFLYTLVDNAVTRPGGVVIGSIFVLSIVAVSVMSRYWRSTELRVIDAKFDSEESRRAWCAMANKKVDLVPVRSMEPLAIVTKMDEIKKAYVVNDPIAFIHVRLADNRSDFVAEPRIKVVQHPDHFTIEVSGANAVANSIAWVSEQIDPIRIFVGLTRQNLMNQALRFLLWGEGETGWMLYSILLRHWKKTPEDDVRPLIYLMSD